MVQTRLILGIEHQSFVQKCGLPASRYVAVVKKGLKSSRALSNFGISFGTTTINLLTRSSKTLYDTAH
uniref:Uncharacterized protein n=1 Tax=Strigamia maritima TaxID=126957 RepID=T1JEA0_STRMM